MTVKLKKVLRVSTFWTERIGFVAANKTLEIFDKIKPWKKFGNMVVTLNYQWNKIAQENILEIVFGYKNNKPKKFFFFQKK